jgi:hypothetical protein
VIAFFTVLMMLAVGYASIMEGLFTAFMMCVNVMTASVMTCTLWEPLAAEMESAFLGTFLAGYEDMLAMVLVFAVSLGLLRTISNNLVNTQVEYEETFQRLGAAVFGMISGYLTAGFFVCALQTLPWDQNFMGFEPRYDPGQSVVRSVLPPDRLWLALMHYGSDNGFANSDDQGFDEAGTFELRYSRYRRHAEGRAPLQYRGEFDADLGRGMPGRR